MKFLSTTLLLALASVAAGDRDWSKVKAHAENTKSDTVQSRENVKVKCKDMFMIPRSLGVGKGTYLIPRANEVGENKAKRCSRRVRERRHLQEGVTVEGPEKGAEFETSTTIPITFTGLPTDATEVVLTFTRSDGTETPIPVDPLIGIDEEGVLEIFSNPSDTMPGIYTFKLTYVEDGDPVTINGENSFSWGVPIRQSRSFTDIVGEAEYPYGGQVQGTSGRIYYSSFDVDYACSGTVVKDNKTGRTLILTAAHCVWDDIDEVWGTNVIFIPNRDAVDDEGLTASEIHRECENDICGCWYVDGGVVHDKWRDTPWPARLDYDYGFWIVADEWSHTGNFCGSEALDVAVDPLTFGVGIDLEGEHVTGLGYSVEYNPDFRYCADTIEYNQPTSGTDTYWLPGCGLTGGASGGPWLLDFDDTDGSGTVVSVNSWSYSDVPGMGGPIIDESEARCLINAARDIDNWELYDRDEGEQGEFINCYDRPCIPEDEDTERKLRGNRRLCEN